MADAELLKIVFVNLFINSAQAMQGQGDDQDRHRGGEWHLPDRRRRLRPGHSRGDSRQALHAVRDHESARHRSGTVDGETPRRGPSGTHSRRLAARRRHDRHHRPSARRRPELSCRRALRLARFLIPLSWQRTCDCRMFAEIFPVTTEKSPGASRARRRRRAADPVVAGRDADRNGPCRGRGRRRRVGDSRAGRRRALRRGRARLSAA